MKTLYEYMLEAMEENRDKEPPCVGIFWYDIRDKKLFGVVKKTVENGTVSGGGLITCKELHKYIWKREFNKQRYKNNGIGPFVGDWKDTPGGRVFYDPKQDRFIVNVGSWISKYTQVIDLVPDEFHLNEYDYDFEVNEHWELGMGWGD